MVDSGATVRSMAEARDYLRPYATMLPGNTVRSDLAAPRADRQRFLTASKELGLTAVAVGAPDFKKSLSAILDGYANHEGTYEVFPLQQDVAKLIAESGITYTPMLLGRVGGHTGIEYMSVSIFRVSKSARTIGDESICTGMPGSHGRSGFLMGGRDANCP